MKPPRVCVGGKGRWDSGKPSVDSLAQSTDATREENGWAARHLFHDRHRNSGGHNSLGILRHHLGDPKLTFQVGCATTEQLGGLAV